MMRFKFDCSEFNTQIPYVGVLFDEGLNYRDLTNAIKYWQIKTENKKFTFGICLRSVRFLNKYDISHNSIDFLKQLNGELFNFWIEPTVNILVDENYDYQMKIRLVDWICGNRGTLLMIRSDEVPTWYTKVYSYAKSLDKCRIIELIGKYEKF